MGELEESVGKYVEIDGFQLAVFLLPGGVVRVIDNYCPHAGGSLADGFVERGCAVCPWHHWAFQLDTGQLRGSPGVTIRTYTTRTFQPAGRPALVQVDLPIY